MYVYSSPVVQSTAYLLGCLSVQQREQPNALFRPETTIWSNVYTPTMFIRLKNQPRCLPRDRQVRPEIVIKGALKYEGESTAWREYEVSDGAIRQHIDVACYSTGSSQFF